jgi:outer membrane protein
MHLQIKKVLLAGIMASCAFGSLVFGVLPDARAETIDGALSKAYQSNPDLNARRAALRAIDETVTRASAAGRPRVTGTADY